MATKIKMIWCEKCISFIFFKIQAQAHDKYRTVRNTELLQSEYSNAAVSLFYKSSWSGMIRRMNINEERNWWYDKLICSFFNVFWIVFYFMN